MRVTLKKVIQWLLFAFLVVFFMSVYTRIAKDYGKILAADFKVDGHDAHVGNGFDHRSAVGNAPHRDNVGHSENKGQNKRSVAGEKLSPTQTEMLWNGKLVFLTKTNGLTRLSDIFISVKTTQKSHRTRLKLLLDTWIESAKAQTYIFTDVYDAELQAKIGGHLINTSCSREHNRQALCCKMAMEYDFFIESGKRWFCHMDDDTYLNPHNLVSLLQSYSHTHDWYLGRPSMTHPIEIIDRDNEGVKVAFWFATGGAGFCISRSLALKMMPHARGGRLMTVGDKIRLPDDCTIGYIIEHLLGQRLTIVDRFHSHLEALVLLTPDNLKNDISFSYSNYSGKWNSVKVPGAVYRESADPTRLMSLHCFLHPRLPRCLSLQHAVS